MIDDVLRELQAVGTVESEGEFTLDRAKAREKMRRFQLADPRAYVLELVQAASLKGATEVRFAIDSRDMVMELDGRPFTTADFDDIYGAALSRRLDHDVLARRQLALGVNSAMALRPSFIEVHSGDGCTGARLRLAPDEDDAFEAIETTRVGTRIHVRERFRLGTFVAFFKDLAGTLAEEQLLRARCGYASFCIDLEGTRLGRGLRLEGEPLLDVLEARTEHTQVAFGLREDGSGPPTLRIVKDGVWITDHELPAERFPAGSFAVVQDHAVRKDVSQGDIVRDDAYHAMMIVVRRAASMAVASLVQLHEAGRAPSWAAAELRRQVWRLAELGDPTDVDEPTGRVRALRRLPLWQTTDRRPLGLDDLFAEVEAHGRVAITARDRFDGLVVPGQSFVVYLVGVDEDATRRKEILQLIFGDRLRTVSDELARMQRRETARKAWRARPAEPRLPQGSYLVRRQVEAPGVRAELGITVEPTGRAHVGLVVDGCLLADVPLELPWLGLRIAVEADAFTPSESFTSIQRDAATFRALLPLAEALPALYGDLARVPPGSWRDACARSFLESLLRGESLGPALAMPLCEVAEPLAAAEVEAFGAARLRPELGLLTDAPHPTATMPLYRTLGVRRYSLVQLVERARADERISVVAEAEPGISADILVLDDDDRALLQPLFARPFEDGRKEVTRLVREREFLRRPTGAPTLDARAPAVVVPIEGDAITGMLRVEPAAEHSVRSQPITVLHRKRRIGELPLLLVGRCDGWVESTEVQPRADYSGVANGPELDAVRAAVLRAFAAACLRIAERARAERHVLDLAFLREVATLPFPTKALRAVHDKLTRTKAVAQPQVADAYRRLYAALHGGGPGGAAELEQRMWRASTSKTALADVLAIQSPKRRERWALAALDVLFPPAEAAEDPGRRVLRPVAALAELPLFQRHDGRGLSIAELRGLPRGETVLHIDGPADDVDLGTRVVVHADGTQVEILRRILGGGRLLRGDGTVARERQKLALQAKPEAKVIALAPGDALVSVRWEETKGRKTTEGEVGLAREHPGDPSRPPRLRLRVYRARKEIQVAQVDEQPAELVAAANDDRLTLSADLRAVHRNKTFEVLVERCQARAPELMARLVASWSGLSFEARTSAWYHVLDFLRARAPGSLDAWGHEGATGQWFQQAAAIPGFTATSGGTLSALQLVEAHRRHDRLEVLPAPSIGWGRSPLPPDRPVVCVDAYERLVLQALFPTVEDVEGSWPIWQERARNFAAARAASTAADVRALVTHELSTPGIQGWLAIPSEPRALGIELCAEGRVAGVRRIDGVLPCVGSVAGHHVEPDERFTDATIDPRGVTALQVASVELYRALGRWFAEHPEHPEHPRVAALLADQVIALGRRGKALELGRELLLAELRELPVLALRNGRRISLHTALQEQPDELGHLDLWAARAHRLQQVFFDDPPRSTPAEAAPTPAATMAAASPPAPAWPPAPPPPEPTPEERLVDALRGELGLLRERNRSLLANEHLDRIRVTPVPRKHRALVALADADGVMVNRDHPVVQRALAHHQADPVWASYVSSAVYTALNVWLEEVTDADERLFLAHLAQLVVSG